MQPSANPQELSSIVFGHPIFAKEPGLPLLDVVLSVFSLLSVLNGVVPGI